MLKKAYKIYLQCLRKCIKANIGHTFTQLNLSTFWAASVILSTL